MGLPAAVTLRDALHDRRDRLQEAISTSRNAGSLARLLDEVDSALERLDSDTYGTCEICHEPLTEEELVANPLARYCLCDLSEAQLSDLGDDLDLAWRIQGGLLPVPDLRVDGWEVHFRYEPAGPVSGDYVDLIPHEDDLFFAVGDVSGKGVAASLIMAHLSATFRSLITLGLPVNELVSRANAVLHGSTIPSHFATLVCGWARRGGEIEWCNAGHCPPVMVRKIGIEELGSTGLPVGVAEEFEFTAGRDRLEPGESLFLYTDGLTEALDPEGTEYGEKRLSDLLTGDAHITARDLTTACADDLSRFLAGRERGDDLTLMTIRRA